MAKIVMNKKIVDVAVNRGLIKEQKETKEKDTVNEKSGAMCDICGFGLGSSLFY